MHICVCRGAVRANKIYISISRQDWAITWRNLSMTIYDFSADTFSFKIKIHIFLIFLEDFPFHGKYILFIQPSVPKRNIYQVHPDPRPAVGVMGAGIMPCLHSGAHQKCDIILGQRRRNLAPFVNTVSPQ